MARANPSRATVARELLNRLGAAFAGADANTFIHGQHEDLAVADLALFSRPTTLHDRRDRRLHEVVVDRDLKLHLAEQIYTDLMTTVGLGMTPLPPKALHIEHGQSKHLNVRERLLHAFQFARLYDRNDKFHGTAFPVERNQPSSLGTNHRGATTEGTNDMPGYQLLTGMPRPGRARRSAHPSRWGIPKGLRRQAPHSVETRAAENSFTRYANDVPKKSQHPTMAVLG